jgi:hypothetical protein
MAMIRIIDSMNWIPSFKVKMDLQDVFYLSYMIPKERLTSHIHEQLPFAVSHEDNTIISCVFFKSRNVRASFFPFLRFDYDQANIRTYVIDPVSGKTAVMFLKSGITSKFVSMATGLIGIPWLPISVRVATTQSNDNKKHYSVDGTWGDDFSIDLTRNSNPLQETAPFSTTGEMINFLTGPKVGFYSTASGVIRFNVRHSVVEPLFGSVSSISFPIVVESGLALPEELHHPQSVLIATDASFEITMPPTKISL